MKGMEMNILETQIVQREYDGRWERIVKIMDKENSYTYTNESGISVTLIPEKWIVTEVYDFIMELEE
jgi:hypothetical protein